jgi:hypothetical protein
MKYYLIIGYYLFEKYKQNPICRIFLGNQFVTEFECDNTDTIPVELSIKNINRFDSTDGNPYVYTREREQNISFTMPAKAKVIELDLEDKYAGENVVIELRNNPSNNNNGFMTKRNLVSFRPIYLVPAFLLKNSQRLNKFLKKSYEISRDILINRRLGFNDKWAWPGFHDQEIPPFIGGKQKLIFQIKKKLNFYYLASDKTKFPSFQPEKNPNDIPNPVGFPQIETFFYAWINHITKNKRDYVYEGCVTSHNGVLEKKLKIDIKDAPYLKINTSNNEN